MAREFTPEGFLRAGARLTRVGEFQYLAKELGLPGDEMVTVHRTLESLKHPDTLASLRGAPLIVGHVNEVNPENWKKHVAGSVVGEPRIDGQDVVGDVIIGDKEGLLALEQGKSELSVGYDFSIDVDSEGRYITRGPIRINHVALVEKGRAGPRIRVLDKLPQREESKMTDKEIADAVSAAVDMSMKKHGDSNVSTDAVVSAVMDKMKPMMEDMKKMKDAAAKAEDEKKAAENKKKAQDAAKTLVDSTRAEERARFKVLEDAKPFLSEEDYTAVQDKEPKEILIKALGDSVPDAADKSYDYLSGALDIAKKAHDAQEKAGGGGGNLPTGVKPFKGQDAGDPSKIRETAMAEAIKAQDKMYEDKGGR